jgi:uncharacterized protein YeaO (DUF488 family)
MAKSLKIKARRAYDEPGPEDGARFLVDRLWPRGRKKESLKLDGWLKDAAPSEALRKGFCHDPAKWDDFKKRYTKELDTHPEAWLPILVAARKGKVTLVYGAKDEEHNNAVALMEYLKGKAGKRDK